MKWMEPFYVGEIAAEEINQMKAEAESFDNKQYGNCYLILLPANKNNLFEIMSFHQLAIPYYQTIDLKIVGLAKDKDDATNVVCRIIEDLDKNNSGYNVLDYFK